MKHIAVLDIETTGLSLKKDKITCVGIWTAAGGEVYRDLTKLQGRINDLIRDDYGFVGHNFKFDLKFLWNEGVDLPITAWVGDTQYMAGVSLVKPSEAFLEKYNAQRVVENKKLPQGVSHRPAGQHSLKTQAPFWLKVEPFWEDPTNHDNDEYVLKDCEYTYRLYYKLYEELSRDEIDFYEKRMMRWAKTLCRAEYYGVRLDLEKLETLKAHSEREAARAKMQLDRVWAPHYAAWIDKSAARLRADSDKRLKARIEKLKDKGKIPNMTARYAESLDKKISDLPPFNLDSPAQLLWLLKERLGLEVTTIDGDESTGKEVLQSLAAKGNEDLNSLLTYREHRKLATAFYPSYEDMAFRGRIHCSFNLTGTRTGRLSSSEPNLQQVPRGIKDLFQADPGYLLATFDQSAVEARAIAEVTCDEALVEICNQGISFHDYNTKYIYFDGEIRCDVRDIKKLYPVERDVSKEVGFATFYGAGWKRVQASATKRGFSWPEEKCKRIVKRFRERYAGAYIFKKEILDPVLSRGEYVPNMLGRPIWVENKEDVYMKGFNKLIQSSASDIVQESATRIQEEFDRRGIDGQVLLLVHDEIVTQIPEKQAQECLDIIQHAMVNYSLDYVNFEVEGGASKVWAK